MPPGVSQQHVTRLLGIPTGSAQQPLNTVGSRATKVLRELPTVLALHPPEQALNVADRLPPKVMTFEARPDGLRELFEALFPASNRSGIHA